MPFVSLSSNDVAFDLVALIEKITDADRAAEFKEQVRKSSAFVCVVLGGLLIAFRNALIRLRLLQKKFVTQIKNMLTSCIALHCLMSNVHSLISKH